MSILKFRNNRNNNKGSVLTKPLLIIIYGVLGVVFLLSMICFFVFNLTGRYFQFKETSTISGQPLLTLDTSPQLTDDVLVKQIPVTDTNSKSVKQSDSMMRLKIPEINVDALVESVGIIANGEMGVPRGSNNVAWFNLGPSPGEIGSAVIGGHYGTWGTGKSAVFNDLSKLKIGDKILIEDKNGSTTIFVVHEFKSLDDNEDATSVFTSNDGKAHLNLITCSGKFDKISKSYPSRLVILSDKE